MKPLAYSLQFRGRATPAGLDLVRFTLAAPSSAVVTSMGPDGVCGTFEDVAGGEATFETELSLRRDETFDDAGTIEFGRNHRIRVRSVGTGRLLACPDPHLRHGTVVRKVAGGDGQFARAEGFITSNFIVSDTGEVTDNHFGLIFIHDRRREAGGKEQHVRQAIG